MSDETPKRPRGRPPLQAGQLSVKVDFRMCASDYEKAARLAEKHRVSVQHLLRTAFRLAVKRHALDEP